MQSGVVPDSLQDHVYQVMVDNLVNTHDYKITTGVHGLRALYDVLDERGDEHLFYKVVMDERYPGWKYQIDLGATSLWQSFSGEGDLNHAMFGGAPIDLIQRHLLGIEAEKVGITKKVMIQPFTPEGLNNAAGKVTTMFGDIYVSWKKSKNKVLFEIVIPGNIAADFSYKDTSQKLHSGLNKITAQ